MDKFVCTVESIVYQNEESGFAILSATKESDGKGVTLLINMAQANIGITLDVEGTWTQNVRFGEQFKVESWEEILPTSVRGIEKYLSSGLIKGIGPTIARNIVQMFGEASLDVIASHSLDLLKVPKVGSKVAHQIWDSFDLRKGEQEVMVFLKQYNIGTAIGVKIYKEYGEDSIGILQTNPYQLIKDIDGVGFLTADLIAKRIGISETDPLRIESALIYVLSTHCEEGDTYLDTNELINKTFNLLQIDRQLIADTIINLSEREDLIADGSEIFLPTLFFAEKFIARTLYSKAAQPELFKVNEDVVDIERLEITTGIEYDDDQREAIKKAALSNVTIITGGPGTGKTTITHGIVNILDSLGLNILLAAPTGKAADRLSEATGMEATTIHRLLGATPGGGYNHNEDNPLMGDLLIVDEVSMVNTWLMYSLLKAVPDHMRIILIGDVDQLPCIGPGNILSDLIASNTLPTIRLTKIFRQDENSRIIRNAHAINRGDFPTFSNTKDSDFFYLKADTDEEASDIVVDLVRNRLPNAYGIDPKEIQVLTPMKKYASGTVELNQRIQEAINPVGDEIHQGGRIFRVGDKVIQTKNNYDKGIFNGDSGIIIDVDTENKTLVVDFGDSTIYYGTVDMDELLHAYALTIHKSQGSEYPIVVMPITNSHYHMLSKNLLYTGITRAKKICILVGSKDALCWGIKNVKIAKRKTMLMERLREYALAGM